MNKRTTEMLREYLLPTVVCMGLAFALGTTAWLQRLETVTLDNLTRFRVRFQEPPDPRLFTVGIDDDSIEAYGGWPWDRRVHARFLYSISFGKPSVVAWDILFTEPKDSDVFLKTAAAELGGRVVFGAYTNGDDDPGQPPLIPAANQPFTRVEGDLTAVPASAFALLPIPSLQEVGLSAFCDTPAGDGGVRRYMPMIQRVGGRIFPSLSLQTLMTYGNIAPNDVRIVLGDAIYLESETLPRRIPIDEGGRYLINYRFAAQGANLHRYALLTEGYREHFIDEKPRNDLAPISGKILLVGQFSTGLSDNGVTPFGAETPLVLVHANVIDNVLREDYAHRSAAWPVLMGGMLLGLVGLTAFTKRGLGFQAIHGFGVPAAYLAFASFAWISRSLWLPLLWPLAGFGTLQVFMIVRQLVREQRSKAKIKGMFGAYVSPELVNRMIDSGQAPELGGHEENITAYFSDIQGFSVFSEKLPPDKLVVLMNEYLSVCTDIIQEEGGTLDKYIGDAVVAMFGAPLPLPDHAFRACVASQRIHLKLLELRATWEAEEGRWPRIVHEMQSRIGMNSGPVIVGNMGSRTRFNYTMMGDNVNLAARMESGAKSWGVYTLCTEATKAACERDGGDRVVFRALGRIVVRGRSSTVPIHEIVGLRETVTDRARECIRIFEEGLACHYRRDWEGALARFGQSVELEPNQPGVTPGVSTNPSQVYIRIVQRYRIAPPPEGWDGEYVMTEK
jgi:adenylate cyclase